MTDKVAVGIRRDDTIPHYCQECHADIYVLAIHWPLGKLDDVTFLCRQCVDTRAKREFEQAAGPTPEKSAN